METFGGINLGRCWSKYLIIEIFFFSAEDRAQSETEAVLWVSSRRHRNFLAPNYSWYPRILDWIGIWVKMMAKSSQLESLQQGKFLFDHIRIDGEREATKVTRVYRASKKGWTPRDFHRRCH